MGPASGRTPAPQPLAGAGGGASGAGVIATERTFGGGAKDVGAGVPVRGEEEI